MGRLSGGCRKVVFRMSVGYMEGVGWISRWCGNVVLRVGEAVWRVLGRCLEGVWSLYEVCEEAVL